MSLRAENESPLLGLPDLTELETPANPQLSPTRVMILTLSIGSACGGRILNSLESSKESLRFLFQNCIPRDAIHCYFTTKKFSSKFRFLAKCHWPQRRIQDFPSGGANSPGGRQYTILPNFPENCMKLKEFGRPGGHEGLAPPPPLNPPLGLLEGIKDGGTIPIIENITPILECAQPSQLDIFLTQWSVFNKVVKLCIYCPQYLAIVQFITYIDLNSKNILKPNFS